LKLELRKKPYTVRVAPGVRLGCRRNEGTGTWSVIAADGKGGNWVKKFGLADDREEANGEQVLTFWQAQERARKLARGGRNADDEDEGRPVTLREALDAYQADLIARGGDVHNVARVRGHLSNTLYALRHSSIVRDLLANVPVRIVATKHDTSIPMIERNYSKYIADHADVLSRRAMLDPDGIAGDNVISLPQR
jgi:hypothetical protein